MPPVNGPAYLIGYLFEIGPVMDGGFGPVPITYGEIESWCRLTGVTLAPWETRLLRRLSREYLSEARERNDHAPWSPDVTDEELRAVAKSLRAAIGAMAA